MCGEDALCQHCVKNVYLLRTKSNCVESVHCGEIVWFYMFNVSHIQIFHGGDHRYHEIEDVGHPGATLTSFR